MNTLMKRISVACAAGTLIALCGGQARAQTWNEIGDAGSLLGTAQTVVGTGALTRIDGHIGGRNDVDLYKIVISQPLLFSAETTAPVLFDTQLFLFDTDGRGVYSDDDSGVLTLSKLSAGLPQGPQAAGTYYLGISNFNNDPFSADGLIFRTPNLPANGADGPGANAPLLGWNDAGSLPIVGPGLYQIKLTGAAFVPTVSGNAAIPEPGTMALAATGLLPLAGLIRRRRHRRS